MTTTATATATAPTTTTNTTSITSMTDDHAEQKNEERTRNSALAAPSLSYFYTVAIPWPGSPLLVEFQCSACKTNRHSQPAFIVVSGVAQVFQYDCSKSNMPSASPSSLSTRVLQWGTYSHDIHELICIIWHHATYQNIGKSRAVAICDQEQYW